jgi:hypothetical protein
VKYVCTEREKSELCEFKSLQAKRDTYYGNAVCYARADIRERHFPAEKHSPYHIYYGVREKAHAHILAEGGKAESCKFKALRAERYAYYGYAEQNAKHEPRGGYEKSAENYPNQITNETHFLLLI